MKFIHIADVHLGACPEKGTALAKLREEEIYKSFAGIIDICNIEEVSLLLIAGDLFHKQPLVRELKEVNYYFRKLINTKVVLIAGNHDYIGARSYYQDFQWEDHVTMLSSSEMDSIYFEDINTEVYGFSYHTRDIQEAKYQKAAPTVEERINILLAHGGDERNIPIDKKHLLKAGFDYIALGHIHKAEIIDNRMAYPGSLEALDKNELGEHGYIIGEITKQSIGSFNTYESKININFIASCIRSYQKIYIKVTPESTAGELIEKIEVKITESGLKDMYRIYLEGFRDAAMSIDHNKILEMQNVVELNDLTLPDYDFDKLYKDNETNIIGMYINQIRNKTDDEDIARKALYYGIMALLKHKHTA